MDSGKRRLSLPRDLSVCAFKCLGGLGTSPGWTAPSPFNGSACQMAQEVAHPTSLYFSSWQVVLEKTKNLTQLPEFDSPAQPVLVEASGAGLLVTSRCSRAWLHPECRQRGYRLVCVGGLFTDTPRLAAAQSCCVGQGEGEVLTFLPTESSRATLGEGLALLSGIPFAWIPSEDGNQ